MISARDKIIQYNFLHRIHYTPACLYKMGRVDSPECCGCHTEVRDYFHMIWQCPHLVRFWKAVLMCLENRLAIPNVYSPTRCFLGGFGEENLSSNKKTLLNIVFYAKKALALKWKNPTLPPVQFWVDLINRAQTNMPLGVALKNLRSYGQTRSIQSLVTLLLKEM